MPKKKHLTTAEVAELTGIPEATLRFWRWQGTGPVSYRLGRAVRYDLDDVHAWMAASKSETSRGGVQS